MDIQYSTLMSLLVTGTIFSELAIITNTCLTNITLLTDINEYNVLKKMKITRN